MANNPKPTAFKVLTGNPGRRRLNHLEPEPGPSKNEVPSWLPDQAKQYWKDLHPMLERIHVMSEADELALSGLCVTYAAWREAHVFLQEHGALHPLLALNFEHLVFLNFSCSHLKFLKSYIIYITERICI